MYLKRLLAVLLTAALTITALALTIPAVAATGEEEEYDDPTGHCLDWSSYRLTGSSNYCPDTPEFSGFDLAVTPWSSLHPRI